MGGNGGLYGRSAGVGGFGGTGLSLLRANFTNSGEISGGTGGGVRSPLGGGQGVYLGDFATFTNTKSGIIQGGYSMGATAGADGVYIGSTNGFTNAGLINDGAVKYSYSYTFHYGASGHGGARVYLKATGSNNGTIVGGGSGSLGVNLAGVDGGVGLLMNNNFEPDPFRETFVNTGQITGGAGGTGVQYGGNGGAGVYLNYGTLTNAGTITGGTGGHGQRADGGSGDAVTVAGYSALIVENGAVFNGLVAARGGTGKGSDTLEVSGASSAPLTGIGTEFTGFHTVEFAPHAAWTIAGDTIGLASGQAIRGFSSSDAITLTDAAAAQGQVSVGTAGIVTISAGGDIYNLDIKNATLGESFTFSDYTLRESVFSPAPAMTFLRPAEPASASPSPFRALGLEQFMSALAFHGSPLSGTEPAAWANHASLTAGSQLGLIQDISKLPQGDVQTLVTLHA